MGVQLSGIWAVGFFWGGPLSELEVNLPGICAIFSFWAGPLSELGGPDLRAMGLNSKRTEGPAQAHLCHQANLENFIVVSISEFV